MRLSSWPTEVELDLLRAGLLDGAPAREAWDRWRSATGGVPDREALRLLPLAEWNLRRIARSPLQDQGFVETEWLGGGRLVEELSEVFAELKRSRARYLLIKGLALARLYYPHRALRPVGDVDLLVRHSSLEAARAAVERLGYRPVVPEKASRVSHLHAVAFQKPDRPELDLHAFALAEDPSPDADSGFFERAVPFETEWGTEETLSAADHLLCAGVHGLRFANPPSVHWAADAVMIVRRAGSPALWQTLVAEAGRRKLSLWAFRSLKLVGEAFGAPVPAEALDALERDSADRTQRLELAARMRPPSLARGLFLHWRGLARERPGHSRLRRLGAFPRYLSELWELDSVREVPAAAARKSARRLGKRGPAGR